MHCSEVQSVTTLKSGCYTWETLRYWRWWWWRRRFPFKTL